MSYSRLTFRSCSTHRAVSSREQGDTAACTALSTRRYTTECSAFQASQVERRGQAASQRDLLGILGLHSNTALPSVPPQSGEHPELVVQLGPKPGEQSLQLCSPTTLTLSVHPPDTELAARGKEEHPGHLAEVENCERGIG